MGSTDVTAIVNLLLIIIGLLLLSRIDKTLRRMAASKWEDDHRVDR